MYIHIFVYIHNYREEAAEVSSAFDFRFQHSFVSNNLHGALGSHPKAVGWVADYIHIYLFCFDLLCHVSLGASQLCQPEASSCN